MFGYRITGSLVLSACLLGLYGCSGGDKGEFKEQEKGKNVAPPKMEGHDYGPGPHKGRMVDLGSDHRYVAEITYTADPRAITVYVLDHHDTNKPLPIEAESMTLELHGEGGEQPVTLSAEPQEGEAGKSSRFVVKGEAIPESIKDVEDIEGHLNVKLGDKTLEAAFEEHGEHKEHAH